MSRPKPTILCSFTNPRTYRSEQVLKADAIFAVYYDNAPINLRIVDSILSDMPAKYRKVSFSNAGHAFNLAEKLNKQFKTDKFIVVKLTGGEIITESIDE